MWLAGRRGVRWPPLHEMRDAVGRCAERGRWAIRRACAALQGAQSSNPAVCVRHKQKSLPQGRLFCLILAETVSVEHAYEKRRIFTSYPPAYPPVTTGVERLLVNGKVNRQEFARQPRTVQNAFVKALLARTCHQNRDGNWECRTFRFSRRYPT